MKITLEIDIADNLDVAMELARKLRPLTEVFASPAPKNFDDRTDCPTSHTVTEIVTVGSTELNAEPPKDFKVEVKTRKRTKKSDIVTKDEQVALVKAAIDPQDEEDERTVLHYDGDLSHDDLRLAVGAFTKLHGIAKAQELIPQILGCSIAEVPKTQKALAEAINRIKEFDLDEGEDEAAIHATEDDVREALYAYAMKYDGGTDRMVVTPVDGPKILQSVFGDACTAIRHIPKDPVSFGKALAAINAAVSENPFNREVAL